MVALSSYLLKVTKDGSVRLSSSLNDVMEVKLVCSLDRLQTLDLFRLKL